MAYCCEFKSKQYVPTAGPDDAPRREPVALFAYQFRHSNGEQTHATTEVQGRHSRLDIR